MVETSKSTRYPGGTVPTHVAATPGAGVTLRVFEDQDDGKLLMPDQVAALFSLGLATPEPDRTGWVSIGELQLDPAEIQFLVAETALDSDAALLAVERGLVAVIERAVERYLEPTESTEAPAVATDAEGPDTSGPAERPRDASSTVEVSIEEAAESLPELAARVHDTGAHVMLTRDGHVVAALVDFEWYRATRERLARLEAAYWAAWLDGVWRASRYGTLVQALEKPDDLEGRP
ncbi:hypothetical protein [Cellulomonas sp.]|uniref:hypothetical protein n=1 Tax=Cellulomonas sp. TaxID=40001 RepID=UPI003BA95A32